MKRVILFAALFGACAFSGALYAQMGEEPAEPTPQAKPEPAPAPTPETKPEPAPEAKPEGKRPERPARPDRVRPGTEAAKVDKAVLEEEFKTLDRDDDGKLTKDELGTSRADMLDKNDTDKDGTISKDEWVKAREEAIKAKPAEGQRPGKGNPGDYMKELDKDGDGKISKEEAPERLKKRFDDLDKDKDGFLTKEEIADGVKGAMREKGKAGEVKPEGEKPAEPPKEAPKEEPKKEEGSK
ncbi:MAG: EF-hand domain-containing protein [Planctomycetes bacterium]|nr:EF-hand domain-containing protein [Planctomycetota bacterium]